MSLGVCEEVLEYRLSLYLLLYSICDLSVSKKIVLYFYAIESRAASLYRQAWSKPGRQKGKRLKEQVSLSRRGFLAASSCVLGGTMAAKLFANQQAVAGAVPPAVTAAQAVLFRLLEGSAPGLDAG
jgi:hypothetical protein